MNKLELNQRVECSYLGLGNISKIVKGTHNEAFMYVVTFDNRPSKDFNGGCKDVLRFPNQLKIIQ